MSAAGRFSSRYESSASGVPLGRRWNIWRSILMASLEFLTSNEPHSTGDRPSAPAHRSSDSCEASVVLPPPVGPVRSVTSPGRMPRSFSMSCGNDAHCAPLAASGLRSSLSTSRRSPAKSTMRACVGSGAASIAALKSRPLSSASFASLTPNHDDSWWWWWAASAAASAAATSSPSSEEEQEEDDDARTSTSTMRHRHAPSLSAKRFAACRPEASLSSHT
mmetsp:Transcript_5380/g.22201  ORF Transcript_5380/g.22201 Transcript_5380/m.22201 type:complete len:220 (-) Transcript_5380:909-1568(-)